MVGVGAETVPQTGLFLALSTKLDVVALRTRSLLGMVHIISGNILTLNVGLSLQNVFD